MISFVLAWTMSCAQYHGAVQRCADPCFKQPECHEQQEIIGAKTKTWPECLESEA